MSGKGSKQRPTNKATFDENFDRIFGKSKVVSSTINDKENKADADRHKR